MFRMFAPLTSPGRRAASAMLLLLGSVAFAAGMAATLRLSPVVVCFFVGLLLANFPGDYKERVTETLTRLERPIYLLFLLVVGAHWRLQDWRGWALLPTIATPTLIIGGQFDFLVPVPVLQRMRAGLPGARFALGGCDFVGGHLSGNFLAQRDSVHPALQRGQIEPLMGGNQISEAMTPA